MDLVRVVVSLADTATVWMSAHFPADALSKLHAHTAFWDESSLELQRRKLFQGQPVYVIARFDGSVLRGSHGARGLGGAGWLLYTSLGRDDWGVVAEGSALIEAKNNIDAELAAAQHALHDVGSLVHKLGM